MAWNDAVIIHSITLERPPAFGYKGQSSQQRKPDQMMQASTALASQQVLEVSQLVKSYGQVQALAGVDLELSEGEFVALLGPNGAGKSTLFQLLSGLFVADGGILRVCGQDIRQNIVPVLARIGIVFQQSTLDLDLSVAANLRFHARLHGLSDAEERIRRELDRLHLTELASRPTRQLSGGNRRKVELARALVHGPRLLLMDEPTVGLDPASRRQLLEHVVQLRREDGVAVLWATHLVDEAEAADRVEILHLGRNLCAGTAAGIAAGQGCLTLQDAFMKLTATKTESEPDE